MARKAKDKTSMIGLHWNGLYAITPEEYMQIERELLARAMVGDFSAGDRILYHLLKDNAPRFYEITEDVNDAAFYTLMDRE